MGPVKKNELATGRKLCNIRALKQASVVHLAIIKIERKKSQKTSGIRSVTEYWLINLTLKKFDTLKL